MTLKNNHIIKFISLTLFSLLILLPVGGFGAEKNFQKEVRTQNIAVMPFLPGNSAAKKERNLEKSLDCQLIGLCNVEDVQSGAEAAMTAIYQKELKKILGDKVVSLMAVSNAYARLEKSDTKTPRDLALELGKTLMVDHVLVGLVNRYRERGGSSRTVDTPASVSFSVFLLNVQKGRLVWQDSYDKTQTALSENLFDAPMYFKKGMKWLTAEELASYGAQKGLKKLVFK